MVLRARWLPRLQNEEADQLTNLEFHHFDESKRIQVDLDNLGFQVMPMLFAAGEDYMAELEKSRAELKCMRECGQEPERKRKRLGAPQGLRETDPW